jgi:GR25 family glycosyltransferase involved in LPS biosynthesis
MNYLDGIDILYWINMDKATERHQHMKSVFKDDIFKNKKIERISGFDYKNTDIFSMFDMNKRIMSDSEYACLLSHLETIRQFSETNIDVALIFEDDISLEYKKYWKKSLKEIMHDAPKNWEILKICIMREHMYKKLYNRWTEHYKKNCFFELDGNNDWSSAAYIITNQAAKKLIKEIYHNGKYTLDTRSFHYSESVIFSKLKTFVYKYPYFTYRNKPVSQVQLSHVFQIQRKKITDTFYKKINKKINKKNKTQKLKVK